MTRIVGAAALALGLGTLTATSASASTWWTYQGDDYAQYTDSNGFIGVCDMEQDGHTVFGEFYRTNGTKITVTDRNGSSGGCGNDYVTGVYTFRVCEAFTGYDYCSRWQDV